MRSWLRLLTLVVLCPLAARAGVKRVLLISTGSDAASEAKALLTQAELPPLLARDERFELLDLGARLSPEDGLEASRAASLGKTAADGVEALIAQLDFKAAKVRCEEGLQAVQAADFRAVREPTLRLLLQLARIKRTLKLDDGGDAELAQAFAVAPELPAPRGLNAAERRAFEAARARSLALPRATPVLVSGERLQGSVWIDGLFRGVTPLSANGLTPGRHYFTFVAPGGRVASSSELLGSLQKLQLSTTLTAEGQTYRALVASLQAGLRKGAPGPAARELLSWAKADELVLVLSSGGGGEIARFGANGSTRRLLPGSAPSTALALAVSSLFDDALKEELLPMMDPLPMPSAPPLPPAVAVEAAPRKSGTLGKVLLGVGLGAVVAGTAMMVAGAVNYGNAAAVPQVETSTYGEVVGLSNGLHTAGVTTAALGALSVGLGVVFLF